MEKNISQNIKELVAENKLEEALDSLIDVEATIGRERYNTLILLKGKLEMLEEQELAGLMEFNDLSREKRKIAHALLKMADDVEAGQAGVSEKKKNEKTVSKWGNYLLAGVLGVAALIAVLNFLQPSKSDLPENPQQELTEQKEPVEIPPSEPTVEKKENNQPPVPKKEESKPAAEKQETEKATLPADEPEEILISGFPGKGTLGTVKFSFSHVTVEKTSDPDQLKLSFQTDLTCRTNFDTCDRPDFTMKVDGKSFVPAAHSRTKTFIKSGGSATETLAFVFAAGAESYQIKAELYGSTFVRGFKIIQ
ncbi:MAG: hypothetical protein AAFZ15_13825 [Bacteroidota bacterium]